MCVCVYIYYTYTYTNVSMHIHIHTHPTDGAQGWLAGHFRRGRLGLHGAQPDERGQGRRHRAARRGLPVARQDLPHHLPGRLRPGIYI